MLQTKYTTLSEDNNRYNVVRAKTTANVIFRRRKKQNKTNDTRKRKGRKERSKAEGKW